MLAAAMLAAGIADARAEGGVGSIFPALSSALPAEAPSSVFDAKLGTGPDADAELLVSGSWSATVTASLGFQAPQGGSLAFASAQPLLFIQDPELALSFLLYKKIFVEAKVSQDLSQAMYAFGYRGGEGELLKEARIGNDGISFPALPYLSFGQGSYRSFGASALVQDGDFAGKAMVRYDQASRVIRRFVGGTEVADTVISPNAFVTGKYFLTNNAPATNLAVYVESVSGTLTGSDGKSYRKLDASEYSYSAATGEVGLSAAAATRVLAFYSGGACGVLADAVTLPGLGPGDLLYVPPPDPSTGVLDPKLQILGRSPTTAGASTAQAFVSNPASGARASDFQATIRDGGYVEVLPAGLDPSASMSPAQRDEYRRPFESTAADMAWVYTTDFASSVKSPTAPVFTRNVVVRSFSSSTSITIDKDVIAGSVEVTRDGVPDYAFSVDADSGILSFASPPAASEEIVVSYLRQSAERKTGILVGALGGFWDLGSGRSAWAALGTVWSVPGSSYSSGQDSSPGSVSLTGGEKDTEGPFRSEAAVAARYSRDDSTGIYRVEGMESTSDYASSFRPSSGSGYTDTEIAENDLSSLFPGIVNSIHKDGSTQKALQISAGAAPSISASWYKVEDSPAYPSYKTFSFYAKLPPDAALTVTLDDGAASPAKSAEISLLADPARSPTWKLYSLHYGKGDARVYVQDSEGGSERVVVLATSVSPSITSTGSRLLIAVSGMSAGESAWVDEVVLVDSVSRTAFLFEGSASYDDPDLKLGGEDSPILSAMSASAFAQGAVEEDPYASLGGAVKAKLGFLGLGLRARTRVAGRAASFSAGHSLELPAASFPVVVKDGFDYDPGTGAFGRSDSLAIVGGSVAALNLKQSSAWTPAVGILDAGMLLQDWEGGLSLGPSIATFALTARNRSLPPTAPAPSDSGNDYGAAWIGAFPFALPAFEAYSDLREAKASLSVKALSREYLSASLGESTTPGTLGAGGRADTASLRLAAPFSAFGLSLEPFYSRSWKDLRDESAGSLVGDADAALGDIKALPLLYRGVPFAELFSATTASDFADQSAPSGTPLTEASYRPALGLNLGRDYGSSWYDLLAPSALAFSYGRSLDRATSAVTDSSLWSASAKFAAINVFGAMGTSPLGLPFDSDEYLTTIEAEIASPRDGSASSLNLLYHGVATFYAGQADRLDAEGKASVSELPSSSKWSSSLSLALSRRLDRHWLLDLYSLAVKPGEAGAEAAQGGDQKGPSVASLYLSDLKARSPNMRSIWTVVAGLSGVSSDAAAYSPGWSFSESYEAKLTVPERLTLSLVAALSQSRDASTRTLTLGSLLSINAVISF